MVGLLHLKDRMRHVRGNISPTEFARRLGVDRRTVNRWENGTLAPNTESIINLIYAYGVDPHWLLAGETLPLQERISDAERTIVNAIRRADESTVGQVFAALGLARYRIDRQTEGGVWQELGQSDDLENALAIAGAGLCRVVDLQTGQIIAAE